MTTADPETQPANWIALAFSGVGASYSVRVSKNAEYQTGENPSSIVRISIIYWNGCPAVGAVPGGDLCERYRLVCSCLCASWSPSFAPTGWLLTDPQWHGASSHYPILKSPRTGGAMR